MGCGVMECGVCGMGYGVICGVWGVGFGYGVMKVSCPGECGGKCEDRADRG